MIVGIDEVGRGALAGPLCVGVVALGSVELEGLTDSKKLSAKKRLGFDRLIRRQADRAALGWVSAADIDKLGMTGALRLAILRALQQISVRPDDQIIIDGTVNYLKATRYEGQAVTMKQADLLVPSVSAASVIAKVARDNYMRLADPLFSGYGFAAHVGYGTAAHLAALRRLGPTPLHRRSFAPLAPAKHLKRTVKLSSGQRAETTACDYLRARKFEIIDRNWKTRWCEIDIVARTADKVWLVEVKYRLGNRQGSGLDYVTASKLHQMRRAARFWQHFNHYDGDIGLAALEVSGHDYGVTNFVQNL